MNDSFDLPLRIVLLALRRPRLIRPMIGAAWAFRRRDWYRVFPFLPLPSRAYLRWRMETAYGDAGALPPVEEVERFLIWASRARSRARQDDS